MVLAGICIKPRGLMLLNLGASKIDVGKVFPTFPCCSSVQSGISELKGSWGIRLEAWFVRQLTKILDEWISTCQIISSQLYMISQTILVQI